jgi:L-ascorbate metabolism protein UlaG (beta-lactamase superfamily)
MEITLIRNATLLVATGTERILVDPCLADAGSAGPMARRRSRPQRNPTVGLPPNTAELTSGLTAALVSHFRLGHYDHLDDRGRELLAEQRVPVACQRFDAGTLRRAGIDARPLAAGETIPFAGGTVTGVSAVHGHGLVGRLMGPGLGYVLRPPGDASLYLSGDTVLTPDVRRALTELRPDVAVMHAGAAQLDIGRPILMTLEEQLEFVRLAPGRVIATHLGSFNHCHVEREDLAAALDREGLRERVEIPADGATVRIVE